MARFGSCSGFAGSPPGGRRARLPDGRSVRVGLAVGLLLGLVGCGAGRDADSAWEARVRDLEAKNRALAARLAEAERAGGEGEAPPPGGCARHGDGPEGGDSGSDEGGFVGSPSEDVEALPERPPLQVVSLAPGGPAQAVSPAEPVGREAADAGKTRPVLRLHGNEAPRVLHVVDTPEDAGEGGARGGPPAGGGAAPDDYGAALSLVQARRFGDAVAAFSAFLERHPDHSYSDNALYWLAECHYARGDYVGARREFQRLIQRYPEGNKVPDAWLKLGLTHDRLGDRAAAQRAFGELQKTYPRATATHRIPPRYLGTKP